MVRALHQYVDAAVKAAVRKPVAEPTLYFGSVDEFVREYLRLVYHRRVDGRGQHRVWAAEWWSYDEAVIRLEALRRAWEHARPMSAGGTTAC